ncbi:rhomboid family intramembrane serine protease [Chromatiaceae bacterium AAb-1]|nr:rhomboid family intramembrane serine protease [Chromatiaceae bacterium AAb-1]
MTYQTLKCPCCEDITLQHIEMHGQQLDVCPRCNGVWFDDSELSEAIRHKHDIKDEYCIKQGFGEKLEQHVYHCHRCNVAMQQFHLLKDYHVEVDSCPNCHGLWVDGDEVSLVLAAPKLQHALEQLNQKVNVKSWLFQFLTRMPKEYNIKPHRTPYMTWTLLVLNTLIYVMYGFDYDATEWMFRNFAIDSLFIMEGQHLWSFFSYQFLHGGWIHLLGNMYFLWIIGDNLEDALGPWAFLGYYLLCGVAAAILELVMTTLVGRELLMVGASGAVAGLFGMYLLWFRHASLTFMFIIWQKKLNPVWYFAIWAGMNIYGLLSEGLGVAYWAHLGGLATGLIIGVLFKEKVLQHNPLIQLLQRPEAKIIR